MARELHGTRRPTLLHTNAHTHTYFLQFVKSCVHLQQGDEWCCTNLAPCCCSPVCNFRPASFPVSDFFVYSYCCHHRHHCRHPKWVAAQNQTSARSICGKIGAQAWIYDTLWCLFLCRRFRVFTLGRHWHFGSWHGPVRSSNSLPVEISCMECQSRRSVGCHLGCI